ncbi:MAG: response regulator transcription factor [Spirochaetia bacterium]|jgi:two-component system phosphate regulon response regulator OmpR|nr:response regulator transcription factor [Spirochaetia bacterium]
MIKILMIDDDAKLRELISQYLYEYGFEVFHHEDGNGVAEKIESVAPELILLDVMLPVKNGIEILREIRPYQIPIIMLTAKGSETDRIVGLELGADDYIPKPFNSRELLARMKAVLRRYGYDKSKPTPPPSGLKKITAGNLSLNPESLSLECGVKKIELSKTEYSILECLMASPNIAFSRDSIMNEARGRDFIAFDRSIDVQISRLRSKIESVCGDKNRIKTVWGIGYMFIE